MVSEHGCVFSTLNYITYNEKMLIIKNNSISKILGRVDLVLVKANCLPISLLTITEHPRLFKEHRATTPTYLGVNNIKQTRYNPMLLAKT